MTRQVKNPQITDEAADWAVRLDAGSLGADEKRKLAEWLLESPRHVEELLLVSSIYAGLDDVDPDKTLSVAQLLADPVSEVVSIAPAREAGANANDRRSGESVMSGVSAHWRGAAAAAAALIAVIVCAAIWTATSPRQIASTANPEILATKLGEQRSMTLDDGSVVFVNTQSRVAIRYERRERVIELLRGEAMFEVAHDPDRPFRVVAGDTVAEAVGTTFNVFRDDERTSVAVIEGSVAVETSSASDVEPDQEPEILNGAQDRPAAPRPAANRLTDGRLLLNAGERADFGLSQRRVAVRSANVEAISSWRMRRLVFETDTLATIASEFNRYNSTKIVVDDPALAAMEFSGVFDADDPQSFIAFLELSGDISVERGRQRITLAASEKG